MKSYTLWPHLQGGKIKGRIYNEITDTSLISFHLPEDDHMIGRKYELI